MTITQLGKKENYNQLRYATDCHGMTLESCTVTELSVVVGTVL